MGVGSTPSPRLSPKSGLPTDLFHQIHTAPCFGAFVVWCQRFPLPRGCFSSVLLFGVGADGMLASKIWGVERSSDVHLCLGKCKLRCCHFKFTVAWIAASGSISGHYSAARRSACRSCTR